LDLEEYVKELLKRNNKKYHLTFQDFKKEFKLPFKDPRIDFKPLNDKEIFYIITGESEESLKNDSIIQGI
jgi:transcription elongation factor SPT6